jgi:hypothetical protein
MARSVGRAINSSERLASYIAPGEANRCPFRDLLIL